MNKLILLVLCISLQLQVSANHFTGAQLRYEYTGTSMLYRLHLTLYKTCESGAIDLPTFINVYAESKSNNLVINKNLPRITNDTLKPFCPGTTTTCNNLSAAYPGYIVAEYIDTIKMPVSATDWNFIFSNSNRNFGITNLQGASGQSFYVEAPLNLALLNNTSAVMPDYPPHVLFVNDSIKIPLTSFDADGDSVTYFLTQPVSGAGVGIPYYAGYSVNQPFGNGGLCYIDAGDNLVLKSTLTGKFTLTLKINEYRNGALAGYTLRDFIVICINSTPGSKLSVPEPKSTVNMYTFTCPGRNNSLSFNFVDPNPTDSVYLEITAPNLAGWTFNTSVSPGTGSATGSINWTTPVSANPATLPFINIIVKARDNSCRLQGNATYVYKVQIRDCSADSVWPGDANSDKIADLYDPLAIALTYADTGVARPGASTNWVGEYCGFWTGSFLNNIDKKHADCNGDGIVDTADLQAIKLNYGKIHAKGGPKYKTTATPDLYFDHAGISANPDSTVSIKIILGSTTSTMTDLYGLATNILVDGLALANPPVISYTSSWLGTPANTLSFTKDVSATSIDWVYARTNKQNISGQGVIANIDFKIPLSTLGGTLVTLSFDKTKLIDKDGLDKVDFNAMEDTFYVWYPASVSEHNQPVHSIQLYPNPSKKNVTVSLYAQQPSDMTITVSDITGKRLIFNNVLLQQGKNSVNLPAEALVPGVYLVNISSADAGLSQTLKWVKQ